MAIAFRWLLRVFLALVAVALVVAALVYHLAARSLPDYDATHYVSTLSAPVEIVRDTANVPHIFGESDPDTFFGLGFVHAQDRLWQMMMLRRTVQGRLSELFGARTIKIDETLRRFDLYRLSQQSVAAQEPYTLAALEAYAAGVNAWIATMNDGARGRGAPEYFLFDPAISPWQPADSIAIAKLMALRLTSHFDNEVLRTRLALQLPPERLRDILPDMPGDGVAVLPSQMQGNLEFSPANLTYNGIKRDPLSPIRGADFAGASNVWAADALRSASGASLLANDPHLGFSAPSFWYLARLELETGGVIGGTIPGIPAIIVGRNAEIAWGLTTANADDVDLYIEELDPDDADKYRTPEGFRPFQSRGEILRVKDADPITLDLRWTENGPVLPPDLFGLVNVTPPGHVISSAWTALTPDDTSIEAALRLMRAQSVDTALEAVEGYVAPAQNLVVADRERVALQLIGALPRRSVEHETEGRLVSRGWIPANRWQGTLDYEANPRFVDPESGILGNTNNKLIDRPFPLHVSHDWGDSQRILRWQRLMREREVHSRDSFVGAQLDTVSPSARTLLPLIGADLFYTGEASEEGSTERRRRSALDLLANWNGEMNEHLPEPLIYSAWIRFLQQRLIEDQLGSALAAELAQPDPLFLERVFRDVDGAAIWCDTVQSSAVETCSDVARQALDDALQWLSETYRGPPESLHWGDAHMAAHDHQVLGDIPVLGWLVNIRQSSSGGDDTLMRGVSRGYGPDPFANVHGAGYRGVYDLADPDSSLFIISTGQSGHPLSRHYDDMGELWRRGEYVPMSLDPDLARAASVGTTRLEPRR